ncbi:MAG: alpha/beta fold hydrolase [Polyangiaceae bacterium]|nr:alpha/beta fold hydrolase [Polyangiaceae bacterium]
MSETRVLRTGFVFAALVAGCAGQTDAQRPLRPLLSEMAKEAPNASQKGDSSRGAILGADKSRIGFERIAKYPEPGANVPRKFGASPDGKLVTWLASESGDMTYSLFAFDTSTKSSRVLLRAADLPGGSKPLSREEELRRERQRQRASGISTYEWAENAPVMLVPGSGDIFVRAADGALKRLTETPEAEIDPRLCPTGERVGFVRNDDLFVIDVATGKETKLTTGGPPGTTRGQSDFLGQEELGEPHGFFWSPSCDRLVYLEVDERGVAEHPVLGYRGQGPDLMMQKYPLPGAANPKVRAGIIDVKSRKTTWLSWPADTERYMGRFSWAHDGSAVYVQTLDRRQRRLALVKVDPANGKTKELVVENSPSWIEFTQFKSLEKKPQFLWLHDVGGFMHLELRDAATGAPVKTLTSGAWNVYGITRLDEASGRVFFIGNKDATLDRQLYSVPLEGGEIKRWTEEPGVHMAGLDRNAKMVMDMHSAADRPPKVILRKLGGQVLFDLGPKPDPEVASLELRTPEFFTVTVGSGVELHGALLPPRVIEPGKKYPVVVMVYGGPHAQTVLNSWSPRLIWQHLADRGFVVMQVDNRGSGGRGPAFEAPLAGKMGDVELADQIAALDAVAKRPYVDANRVGIYGHSYGGFMAALAMLKAPDKFHVGVSASPVTDFRLYDSAYTERYLGLPKDNAAAYDTTNLTKMAGNLRGKLLLVHALMDENVHFQNAAALIDAFVAANKTFDLLVFPGERHGYRSPVVRKYAYERVIEYLAKNLE